MMPLRDGVKMAKKVLYTIKMFQNSVKYTKTKFQKEHSKSNNIRPFGHQIPKSENLSQVFNIQQSFLKVFPVKDQWELIYIC